MEAVIETKKPSVQQMLNIATNLRDKLKRYSSISLHVDAYSTFDNKTGFWCYIDGPGGVRLDSWSEVIQWYKENINE